MKEIFTLTKEDLAEAYVALKDAPILEADTETEGLNPHSDRWWSVQMSDGKTTKVLVPTNIGLEKFDEFHQLMGLLTNRLIVFHNVTFDIKVLKFNGIEVTDAYCTQNVEKMLNAGLFLRNDLKSVLSRRLGVEISKESRTDFYDGTFRAAHDQNPMSAWTPQLIEYSFGDVGYLLKVRNQQLEEVREKGLDKTLDLELELLFPLAKAEYIGIGIDAEGCRDFQVRMAARADQYNVEVMSELQPLWEQSWRRDYKKSISKWDAWKIKDSQFASRISKFIEQCNENYIEFCLEEKDKDERADFKLEIMEAKAKFKSKIKKEKDKHHLLAPFKAKPKEKGELKLRSSQALKSTFREVSVFLPNTAKETLEQNRSEHPLIEKILEYKKYAKLAEFGELYDKINPVTGRIHASINAIVSTGRMSYSSPNLQQIPSRSDEGKEFRKLFRPREGYKFVGADFAGIELVILSVLSRESLLLDAINRGDDVHCFTMAKFLGIDYETVFKARKKKDYNYDNLLEKALKFEESFDLPALKAIDKSTRDGLTKWVDALRDYMKTISYGLAYQLSAFGMAKKFNSTKEVADKFIALFFAIYPNIGLYVRTIGNTGYQNGFAETVMGRKRFFYPVKKKDYRTIEKEILAQLKKDGINPDSLDHMEWADRIGEATEVNNKEVRSQINAIKREAGNMPIQGTSADITKLAIILFEHSMVDAKFPDDEGAILFVHDEIIAECKEERAYIVSAFLKGAMIDAAHTFLGNNVNIEVNPEITDYWKK